MIDAESFGYSETDYYGSGIHLWRNVLLRAQEEAAGTKLPHGAKEDPQALREAARVWLTKPSLDLYAVCVLARIEYRELLEVNQKRFGGDAT